MIVLSGALVLVALVLLVFGALDRNLPYVYASIGVSLLSLLLLLVGILQRRGELAGNDHDDTATPVTDTSDERVPALVGAEQEQSAAAPPASERTAELAVPAPPDPAASRRVPPAAPVEDDVEPPAEDEPAELEDFEDDEDFQDDGGSGVTVLVVSGRPRYHLEGCRVLRGKEPQPLDRDDARMHGFSPCGVCKPDADETAVQEPTETTEGESFTEALFGGPLFADAPVQETPDGVDTPPADGAPADEDVVPDAPARVRTSALPGRPVQPVLAEVDRSEQDADEQVADLQGDDPADDPDVEVHDEPATPAPDVAADPDEPFEAEPVDAAEPVDEAEPAHESAEPTAVVTVEAPVERVPVEQVTGEEPEPAAEAPAPARKRASSRKATAKRVTAAAADEAPAQDVPVEAVVDVPAKAARKAPAKAAKKVPAKAAKKAPATRAPRKAPAAPVAETPQVKRPMVRAVRADALRLGAPSTGGSTTRVAARGAAPATAPPVVVVPERDRFHRPECRYVRGVAGATTLPKASASRQGYTACGVCQP